MNIMETNEIERSDTPFRAVHPTEIIKSELKARGMTQKNLACLMNMQPANVSRMLKGENITLQTARKLETALGIPADFWMRLQNQYDRDTQVAVIRKDSESRQSKPSQTMSVITPELWDKIMRTDSNDLRMSSIINRLKQISDAYGLDFRTVIWKYRCESEQIWSECLA